MIVETASTSAWQGKKNQIVTIAGIPNNCQVISVSSQPAAIEGPMANPSSRAAQDSCCEKLSGPMANASGRVNFARGRCREHKGGNQMGLST